MQITIPGDAEELVKRKAALAGFTDVGEYVLDLVIADDRQRDAALPDPNDPRIIQTIEDGYASGDAGEISAEFWEERRRKLEQRIAEREKR
ncbi:MAG: hypothetical protein RIC55_28120 [Pirellulaceae bacterium]